jgi:hypothetical protein
MWCSYWRCVLYLPKIGITMASKKLPQPKKIMLREYKIERDSDDKIISITGKCADKIGGKYCVNVRTIAPQDAFQVSRCKSCQKKLQHRKIAEKRKARRALERKAKRTAARAAQSAKLSNASNSRAAQSAKLSKASRR